MASIMRPKSRIAATLLTPMPGHPLWWLAMDSFLDARQWASMIITGLAPSSLHKSAGFAGSFPDSPQIFYNVEIQHQMECVMSP
jgi:hypothetical protein